MKIIEVIDADTNLNEVNFSIADEQMTKEDREANVIVYFNWEWNMEETKRVVTELNPVRICDIYFYENTGNYFAALNWANKLITKDKIEEIIN